MMSARKQQSGEFQARALELFRAGHRVVPIPAGHKGVLLEGWTKLADSQDEDNLVPLMRRANGCGVGVLAKWTSAIDIDVRDYELAQRLAGLADRVIGATVQRIGEPPKLLLPYRTEVPFTKVASQGFRLPGDQPGAKPHKVEVLGRWPAVGGLSHPPGHRPTLSLAGRRAARAR